MSQVGLSYRKSCLLFRTAKGGNKTWVCQVAGSISEMERHPSRTHHGAPSAQRSGWSCVIGSDTNGLGENYVQAEKHYDFFPMWYVKKKDESLDLDANQ